MTRPNLLRMWALGAVVASAAFATAQDQPKVSFSQPVMKASAVLQELSKQSGVYLASDPIVGEIPILVSVKDANLNDVLAKIASAVGGDLMAENQGFRLINSDKLRRAQEQQELQWVIQAFDRSKQRLRNNNASLPDKWDDKTLNDLVAKADASQKAAAERL